LGEILVVGHIGSGYVHPVIKALRPIGARQGEDQGIDAAEGARSEPAGERANPKKEAPDR
jgi:hypothetical protein